MENYTTWNEDLCRGKNAEAFFIANAAEILHRTPETIEKLPQLPHNEGDVDVFFDGSPFCYEIKADGNGGFLRSGNVCVQIANDAGKTQGWLADLQDPSKRPVDYITYLLCSDFLCGAPYAAITIAVDDFCRMCGCPGGGCTNCNRCQPGTPRWQERAFPGYKLTRDKENGSKEKSVLLLPLLDGRLSGTDHTITLLDPPGYLPPYETRNLDKLAAIAANAPGHNYITVHPNGREYS